MKKEILARIIADITGDGHLQFDGKRGVIYFYSKSYKNVKKFKNRFKELFKLKGKIKRKIYTGKVFTSRYYVYFSSKKIAKFLKLKGTPSGNKTNTAFLVPKWIIKANKKIRSSYLRGLFDCESCIYSTKNNNKIRWRIGFEQYKSMSLKNNGIEYLTQIKKMLERFGVIVSPIRFGKKNVRKDGTMSIGIKFEIEHKYFINFHKNIGFEDKIKKIKLLKSLRGLPSLVKIND